MKTPAATCLVTNKRYPSFIVNEMNGKSGTGSIGFSVDIDTEGYFKDFKIL